MDCKLAAARLIVEDDMDVKEVQELLAIHYNTLFRRVSEYEKYGQSAFHGNGVRIYDHNRVDLNSSNFVGLVQDTGRLSYSAGEKSL